METYQILRLIDGLNNTVDNLTRESYRFIQPSTEGCGEKPIERGASIRGLMIELMGRIDGVAQTLHEYEISK